MERRGIILAGGSGTRLYPLSKSVSKQLMPVYDKPMIYYPLSVLMLANIRKILIISTPEDIGGFEKLIGDGSQWGLNVSYAVQPSPDGLAQAFIIGESFLDGHPSALVLGDNLFYGHMLSKVLASASARKEGACIFGYYVRNPEQYGVVGFDSQGKVNSLEEKPTTPKSRYAIPGLYFYDEQVVEFAQSIKPSARGELEITDLNRIYLEAGNLHVELLGRGTAWLDTGDHDSLLDAANFVKAIEARQGLKIACLEEIAYHKGWISAEFLQNQLGDMGRSTYRSYLEEVLSQPVSSISP